MTHSVQRVIARSVIFFCPRIYSVYKLKHILGQQGFADSFHGDHASVCDILVLKLQGNRQWGHPGCPFIRYNNPLLPYDFIILSNQQPINWLPFGRTHCTNITYTLFSGVHVFFLDSLANSVARIIGFDMETCPTGISSLPLLNLKSNNSLKLQTRLFFFKKQ